LENGIGRNRTGAKLAKPYSAKIFKGLISLKIILGLSAICQYIPK
jgi:hypothetical protein